MASDLAILIRFMDDADPLLAWKIGKFQSCLPNS